MCDDKAAEVATETVEQKSPDDAKPETEEKTPETPVTEPITNGSTTPETPKLDSPVIEAESVSEEKPVAVPATNPENGRPESKVELEPENLPINGLSLEETKEKQSEEPIPDEPTIENTEKPAPPPTEIIENPEVCVEPKPMIDSMPPPLPANPPPSSVASFAATTMAPELTDASLANNTETANSAQPTVPNEIANNDIPVETPMNTYNPENLTKDTAASLNESIVEKIEISEPKTDKAEHFEISAPEEIIKPNVSDIKTEKELDTPILNKPQLDSEDIVTKTREMTSEIENLNPKATELNFTPESMTNSTLPPPPPLDEYEQNGEINEKGDTSKPNVNETITENGEKDSSCVKLNGEINGADKISLEGNENDTEHETINKEMKLLQDNILQAECNENGESMDKTETMKSELKTFHAESNEESKEIILMPEHCIPAPMPEVIEAGEISDETSGSLPPPPAELCESPILGESQALSQAPTPGDFPATGEPELTKEAPSLQDILPTSDKLADLIPEIPVVPELKTEMLKETTTDVVAN